MAAWRPGRALDQRPQLGSQGIKPENAWDFGIAVVLAGILGSKILYVILDWRTGNAFGDNLREIFSFSRCRRAACFRAA